MWTLFAITIMSILNTHMVLCYGREGCPEANDIQPCTCIDRKISCYANMDIDLKQIMKSLSDYETYWDQLELSSPYIEELTDSIFNGIAFRRVKIMHCSKLRCVEPRAFDGMETSLEEFIAMGTSFEDADDRHCSIFEALKRLRSLRVINIYNSDIRRIPEDAFYSKANEHSRIRYIDFSGQQGGQLRSIGKNAFASLDDLEYIDLSQHQINQLDPGAFYFEEPGDHEIVINLENNLLDEDSFEGNVFAMNGRVTTLKLAGNPNLRILREETFREFLLNTGRFTRGDTNIVDLRGSPLVCSRENAWILENKSKLQRKIFNAISADKGQDFWKHTAHQCDRRY